VIADLDVRGVVVDRSNLVVATAACHLLFSAREDGGVTAEELIPLGTIPVRIQY
jgi:hypothetical protein